jgi:single-strand DNA-binding protein
MARSINMAVVLGNLTRDPELRYTPSGRAVCNFGVATNRVWNTSEGERREDAEFHNIVAWNRLAEICSQYLTKGQKVYIQGRLQTRTWEGQDGNKRSRTEIVANDMVMLQRPGGVPAPSDAGQAPPPNAPEDYDSRIRSRRSPKSPEVDASDIAKKEIKEEIKREAVAEEGVGNEEQGNAKAPNGGKKVKGKEDVDPKKMPF